MMKIRRLFFSLLCPIVLISCSQSGTEWTLTVDNAGTCSSPRAIDLTGDGIKDIVLGGGGNREWESTENGLLALDGNNGKVLWKTAARNQLVGSPVFLTVDEDETPDVIIGGRSAQLMAVSGKTGRLIWEYLPHQPEFDYRNDTSLLNFFTPQLIPDQDQDQREDLLIAYGGFVLADPDERDRPAGYLMLISSATGRLLHRAPMPDGKETYCSPVVLPVEGNLYVIFGTGGETIAGNLYLTPLSDLLDDRIDQQILLAEGRTKGFIAPPLLADITEDGRPDILVNAYEGRSLAIDGRHFSLIWEVVAGPDLETHSQAAAGYFNGDNIPDFFVQFSEGEWPESYGARQLLIDGKTGRSQILDSLGSLQMSSPIVITDRTAGPGAKLLLSINSKRPTEHPLESGLPLEEYTSGIILFNLENDSRTGLMERRGINLGSTPLLDDLDGDGRPELISCYNLNPYDIDTFGGLQVECMTLTWATGRLSSWNQYMGSKYNAAFDP